MYSDIASGRFDPETGIFQTEVEAEEEGVTDTGDETSESEGDFPESSDIEGEELTNRINALSMAGELAERFDEPGILYVHQDTLKVHSLRSSLDPTFICGRNCGKSHYPIEDLDDADIVSGCIICSSRSHSIPNFLKCREKMQKALFEPFSAAEDTPELTT
eukprot:10198402-Karenia_brevis.AAC.1